MQIIGRMMPFFKTPGVPESDFSGVVAADSADGKWKKGDEVFGLQPSSVSMK